jgi:hypothetical protein
MPTKNALPIARIFYKLLSRDHEDGCVPWQPQGVGGGEYQMGVRGGVLDEKGINRFLNRLLHLCY